MFLWRGISWGVVLGCAATTAGAQTGGCTLDRATGTTVEAQPFAANAWGTGWNTATDRVTFLRQGENGYYRVFMARGDGSDAQDITRGVRELPTKHLGPVTWHPSGKYLLLAAEKQEWTSARLFGSPDYEALPGFGRHNDLWLMTPDGQRVWRLTDEPNTKDEGFLIPIFAPDGRHIVYAWRQPGGTYAIKVAEFVDGTRPHLGQTRTYMPGGAAYYEPGSITSDSRTLLYTSDQDTHSFWKSQIYRMDLDTGRSERLTQGDLYNEHPTVWPTPTGDWVTYMSDREVDRLPMHLFPGTDWWAMRVDGSGQKRLTKLSKKAKGNAEHSNALVLAGTTAPSPDGSYFLGDTQNSIERQTGEVRVIHLRCP